MPPAFKVSTLPDFLGLLLGARPPVRALAVAAADGPDGRGLVALVRADRLVLHHLVVPQRPEPAHLQHGLQERYMCDTIEQQNFYAFKLYSPNGHEASLATSYFLFVFSLPQVRRS